MSLAVLAGAVAGVLIRLLTHPDSLRTTDRFDGRGAFATGVTCAFVLGLLTGATMSHSSAGPSLTLPSALASAALLTYCVFNGGAVALIARQPGARAQLERVS